MKSYRHLSAIALCLATSATADSVPITEVPGVIVSTAAEPVAAGRFEPAWKSLQQYECPEWFRDAKFGIWAHWGPQCEPAAGDWYARGMYEEGSGANKFHNAKYGPPSRFGFKDVINVWKADKWDPEKLVALYRKAGAKYFFAMANHHDNLDLWDSKYQPWNSVAVGPKKNLIAGWAKAARNNGLRFGVSVHASHAYTFYEPAQGGDTKGEFAGVPYDGRLTKADGKGLWWDGLDPQDLYAQNHPRGDGNVHKTWNWGNGASRPDQAYCDKFYNRTMDLINRYQPDLLYFDDTALPLWPVSDAGLKIAAHFYNRKPDSVLFGKILDEEQRKALVWDVERGASNRIEPFPWQTDTCIGSWHYNQADYDKGRYKSPATVIHMLADIVSKNGNLLLNVPVRGDGSIDEKELAVVEGITAWMEVNRECIFATRPWKIFGEGPASDGAPMSGQGFNEGKGKPYTAADVRFTASKDGGTLYAILLGTPDNEVAIKALGASAGLLERAVSKVEQLGGGPVPWTRGDGALTLRPAASAPVAAATVVFKITLE